MLLFHFHGYCSWTGQFSLTFWSKVQGQTESSSPLPAVPRSNKSPQRKELLYLTCWEWERAETLKGFKMFVPSSSEKETWSQRYRSKTEQRPTQKEKEQKQLHDDDDDDDDDDGDVINYIPPLNWINNQSSQLSDTIVVSRQLAGGRWANREALRVETFTTNKEELWKKQREKRTELLTQISWTGLCCNFGNKKRLKIREAAVKL